MATKVQLRRGNASVWTSANPILGAGEIGLELDTGKFKVGNGTDNWTTLPYNASVWNDVTGKPSTFPPSSHTHPPADITGTAVITTDSRLSDARTPAGTNVVPNSMLAQMATKTYKGRTATGTGNPEDVAVATLKTDLVLVKGDVGLGSVDNTTDANKPVSTAQQTAITAINNNASYRTLLSVAGSHTAAKVAGTYAFGFGDPVAVGGAGTLYPLAIIHIVAADLPTINSITTKLRIRAQLFTNDVAPTGNFTFGLYPVTRPATSGGTGLCIYTIGTVVSGSNGASFTTPAADGLLTAVGSDFALPADGVYVIAVVTTATIAASSHIHMNAQLQMRNS